MDVAQAFPLSKIAKIGKLREANPERVLFHSKQLILLKKPQNAKN